MIEVDARGLPCPRPVIEAKRALEKIEAGEITVLVDSPESRENVTRFARSQGCQVHVTEQDGVFRIGIVKAQAAQPEKSESPASEARRSGGGVVVLVTSDRLGTGDDRLGQILMRAFLNTLWDHQPRPSRLMFINSGVRLAVEGSEVLDTLHLLERDGVRVFSCGTCLDYYGIKDKLKVGAVTNMYDTVASLMAAEKVIRI